MRKEEGTVNIITGSEAIKWNFGRVSYVRSIEDIDNDTTLANAS
jgi:hypothetical protein